MASNNKEIQVMDMEPPGAMEMELPKTDKRFIVFVIFAYLYLSVSAGLFYSFGGLATDLKTAGDFSQTQINTLGGVCYTAGLSIMWLVAIFARKSLWGTYLISLCFPVIGWGFLGWVMYNCPGNFAAVMVGYFFACIGNCAPSPATVLFASFMFNPHTMNSLNDYRTKKETEIDDVAKKVNRYSVLGLNVIFASSGGLASVIYLYLPGDPQYKLGKFFIVSCVMSAVSLIIGIFWMVGEKSISNRLREEGGRLEVEEDEQENEQQQTTTTKPYQNKSLLTRFKEVLADVNLWLGFSALFALMGPSVNFYNNAGSMMLAMGADEDTLGIVYLEFSVGQVVGRVITSLLITRKESVWGPTVCLLLFSVALFVESLVLYLDMSLWLIQLFTVVNAMVYGSLWTVVFEIPIPGKLLRKDSENETGFGWAEVYGILCLAPAFSPLFFDYLSGTLYDHHIDETDSIFCYGHDCYSHYFFICIFVTIVGFLFSCGLAKTLKERERGGKKKGEEEGEEGEGKKLLL